MRFRKGEIGPPLQGRIDLEKYASSMGKHGFMLTGKQPRRIGFKRFGRLSWFLRGFIAALLLTLVSSTTPEQAGDNLRAWKALIGGEHGQENR